MVCGTPLRLKWKLFGNCCYYDIRTPPRACPRCRGNRLIVYLFRQRTAHAHVAPRVSLLKWMQGEIRSVHQRPLSGRYAALVSASNWVRVEVYLPGHLRYPFCEIMKVATAVKQKSLAATRATRVPLRTKGARCSPPGSQLSPHRRIILHHWPDKPMESRLDAALAPTKLGKSRQGQRQFRLLTQSLPTSPMG